MNRLRTAALLVLVAFALVGCGDDDESTIGSGGVSARTVAIDMVDIAFEPDSILG